MTPRLYVLGFAAALAALIISACGEAAGKGYPDYRYRLTVEVETPEGIKSDSSVIEVRTKVTSKYSIPDAGSVISRVKGEAVAVDLGKRGVLFVLLRSENDLEWANRILYAVTGPVTLKEAEAAGYNSDNNIRLDMRMQRIYDLKGRHDLPRYIDYSYSPVTVKPERGELRSAYPVMVTFDDLKVPESIQPVDPDNLAMAFGDGVKLKRITVERTEDAVTKTIYKWLPWIPKQRGSLVKYPPRTPRVEKPPHHRLHDGDFSVRLYQ